MAYALDDTGSRDMLLLETDEKEQIALADFDLDALREYRKNEVWGNAYRRPQKYTILTDNSVREPFCRSDFPR